MATVICSERRGCKHYLECGASKPHDDSSCEPCPFNSEAKCYLVIIPLQESNIESP